MGAFWFHDLDDWCREDGIEFREFAGWMTRSRSTGGFDDVWGQVDHHTGSEATWQNDCAYMWLNAATRPIGNVHLDRAGVITIGAAGATNTNGRGIANWQTSSGVIPIEPSTMGNRMAFALEAANNGVGELWPREQIHAYLRFNAMLCRRLGHDPLRDVNTHRGWAGTRKSDPFGPAEGYPTLGAGTWPVPVLRTLVAAEIPPPLPDPPTDPSEDIMKIYLARNATNQYELRSGNGVMAVVYRSMEWGAFIAQWKASNRKFYHPITDQPLDPNKGMEGIPVLTETQSDLFVGYPDYERTGRDEG